METGTAGYEGWAILELMGHRRLAGYVRDAVIAGQGFLRIDIPTVPDPTTQFYGAQAVYAITPTTEETARRVAMMIRPAPVHEWKLRAPALGTREEDEG